MAIGDQTGDIAPSEAKAGTQVQADGDRAHSTQRGAEPGAVGTCLAAKIQRAKDQHDSDGKRRQATEAGQRPRNSRNWVPMKTERLTLVAPGTSCERA